MPRDTPSTAIEAGTAGGMIDVECRACGATTKVPASQESALRCGKCGAAGDKVRDRFSSPLFRDHVGRPLRVRDLYAVGQELHLWCSHCRPAHLVRFATAREIEMLVNAVNPTVGEACRHLVCPVSLRHGMAAVASAPKIGGAQMRLPLVPRANPIHRRRTP